MDGIQVLFDRVDRCFRFGDEVTGRVVIDAGSDFTCAQVNISYAWRTHGRGDTDKGPERTLMLAAHDISFRKGQCKEFPFSFTAPLAPVTYHGRELNVDWYLAASASRPHRSDLTCEQDFLLLAGEPTGPVVLGEEQLTRVGISGRPGLQGKASWGDQPLSNKGCQDGDQAALKARD